MCPQSSTARTKGFVLHSILVLHVCIRNDLIISKVVAVVGGRVSIFPGPSGSLGPGLYSAFESL